MQINNYSITRGTAAVLTCIEECNSLHGHIYEALGMHYSEAQIAMWGENEKEKLGYEMFEALLKVQEELFKIMKGVIIANLCTTSKEKEI